MMRILLSLFLLTVSVSADTWQKHVITSKKRYLTAVAGDFNGDGVVDVASSSRGGVQLFLAPDYQEQLIHSFPGEKGGKSSCIYAETLDVDSDGDLDFIGVLGHGNPFWLENEGDKRPWTYRVIDHDIVNSHDVIIADVNNDGQKDLIINNFSKEGAVGESLMWLEAPPNVREAPHWTRHVFADGDAPGGSHYFGFGDLDGDGWGEIAIAAKGGKFEFGNWFAYWSNPGEKEAVKSPWRKTLISDKEIGATNIQIGDVDGDGQADFLSTLGHGVGVVWFQAPDWERHVIDAEMKSPHSLVLVDLDQDGDLDAASCGFESKRVSAYYNDGKGQFTRKDLDLDQASYDLKAFDIDGDGDLDLLNAGRQSNNIVWYENPASTTKEDSE